MFRTAAAAAYLDRLTATCLHHAGTGGARPAGLPGAAHATGATPSMRPACRSCIACVPASPVRRRTSPGATPEAEVVVFADAGHALFVDDAQRFNAVLATFLRRESMDVNALLPLLLVSLASTGIEIALTRYFAVASWSEYGYWVISIVMAGFALSGVVVALARDWLERHSARLFAFLPAALIVDGGGRLCARHPQSVQSAAAAEPGHHHAADPVHRPLLSRTAAVFLPHRAVHQPLLRACSRQAPRGSMPSISAGAGLGALLVLALMVVLHPFRLLPALLLPLAVDGAVRAARRRMAGRARRPPLSASSAARRC